MTIDAGARLALHEAGHATVAAALGIRVETVTVWYEGVPGRWLPGGGVAWSHAGIAPMNRVTVCMAGIAAEYLKGFHVHPADLKAEPPPGIPVQRPNDHDLAIAALMEMPTIRAGRYDPIIESEWRRAIRLLERPTNWHATINLTNALIEGLRNAGRAAEDRFAACGEPARAEVEIQKATLDALLPYPR